MSRPVNAEVVLRRHESTENLIKRFSKKVKNEKIVEEFRSRMYYEKPSDKRRREKARAKLKRLKEK
jgi:small subunit ribosomal protein S21